MYPALKRALALLYSLEKAWLTQFASGLPTHMRIRLKGSVTNALYLASEGFVTDEPELYKAWLVQYELEKPNRDVSPPFNASFQLA